MLINNVNYVNNINVHKISFTVTIMSVNIAQSAVCVVIFENFISLYQNCNSRDLLSCHKTCNKSHVPN